MKTSSIVRYLAGVVIVIGAFGGAAVSGCAQSHHRDWPVRLPAPDWEEQLGPIEPVPLEPVDPPSPPPMWTAWMPPISPSVSFPLLPSDEPDASRSVGGTSHGWLFRGRQPRLPHPHLGFLDVQYERGYFFGTHEVVEMLAAAAADVAERHDGAVTYLGNLSRRSGGDIPQSFSHNSGRDADVAFFLQTPEGKRAVPQDFVSLDERGIYKGPLGEFHWDDELNWTWFASLLRHGGDDLQYVFLSRPLQQRLLEEGRSRGASEELLGMARRVLRQPAGAPPHSDHYHLRTYCSAVSMASGCREDGPVRRWHDPADRARRDAIRRADAGIDHDVASVRRRALERLALLDEDAARRAAIEKLSDEAAVVRAAAVRILGSVESGVAGLASLLQREQHAHVYVEAVNALAGTPDEGATQVLAELFGKSRILESHALPHADSRIYVAEALSRREDAAAVPVLIEGLSADHREVRWASARALRFVTNRSMARRDVWKYGPASRRAMAVARWRAWASASGSDRRAWLVQGFQAAGYQVKDLTADSVWPLCRAILGDEHVSWNAQKTLMRIADRHPRSLRWPKEAANFFWRRWFEKRIGRYGAPPVPREMSTLDEAY